MREEERKDEVGEMRREGKEEAEELKKRDGGAVILKSFGGELVRTWVFLLERTKLKEIAKVKPLL